MSEAGITATKRIDWADIFKGITIIFIVLGHAGAPFTAYLYLFHVPAFFFISGYVANLDKDSLKEYFWNRLRQLIIPFLSINLFFIFLSYLITLLGLDHVFLSSPVDNLVFLSLLKNLFAQSSSVDLGGATWFLIVLFTASMLAKLIHGGIQLIPKVEAHPDISVWLLLIVSIASMTFGYSLYHSSTYYPYLFDLSLSALFYFALGRFFRHFSLFEKSERAIALLLPVASILIYYFVKVSWAPMNWPTRSFAPTPIQNVLSSLAGIYLVYLVSRAFLLNENTKRFGLYLGGRTLTILAFHFLAFKIVFLLFYFLKLVPGDQLQQILPLNYAYWLPITAFAIYVSIGIDYVLRKSEISRFLFLGMKPSQSVGDALRDFFAGIFDGSVKEALTVVSLSAIFLIIYAQKAFTGFFMGEDFAWYSIYLKANENLLRAMFIPYGPFFRPVIVGWANVTHLLLPWDATIYHLRNFTFTLINIFLLYQVLLLIVRSRMARLLGISFFVLSKVHLTIIGWIGIFDSNIILLHFLATILFVIRYLQKNKITDYLLSLVFFTLGIFTKDNSFLFILVVLSIFFLYPFESRERFKNLKVVLVQTVPFIISTIVYLSIRFSLLGLPSFSNSANDASEYAIRLEPGLIFRNGVVFLGNLFNLSLANFFPDYKDIITMRMGSGDFSWLFTRNTGVSIAYEAAIILLGLAALCTSIVIVARQRRWALFCLVLATATIAPTFLVRMNIIYYVYEAVAGVAILVAFSLDQQSSGRKAVVSMWAVMLLIFGLNGAAHNWNIDIYAWRFVTEITQDINQKIFLPNRSKKIDSLTILTPDQDQAVFMQYVINPDGNQAVIRALLSPTPITLAIKPLDQVTRKDKKAGPNDLVYEMTADRQFRKYRSNSLTSCLTFEQGTSDVREAWVFNTVTSLQSNQDVGFVSDGLQSIRLDVEAAGKAEVYYGGVELDWVDSNSLAFDLWVDKPEDIRAIYVYFMDNLGQPIESWVNNNPSSTLTSNQKLSILLVPEQNSVNNFVRSSFPNSSPIALIQMVVELKEGKKVTIYFDQMCQVASNAP